MKKTGIIKAIMLCRKYEKLSPEEREKLRGERLRDLVCHARKDSPYYRELYRNLPENWSLKDLLPVDKKSLMENWNDWVCDRELNLETVEAFLENKDNIGRKLNKKYMVLTTSGSTGEPLVAVCDDTANNIMSGIAVCRSYARKEDLRAFMKQGGKSIGVFADEGFYLGNSSIRYRMRTMPWKKRQLAVSSALYPIDRIVEQLNRFQPAMLGGYPSNLELLIEEAKAGRLNISPVIIMTGGEYLPDRLREELARTFRCYVQTSYSCTEGGTVACECRHRHFHINEDWLIVEPVDREGHPVPDGVRSDKILLTNLYNYTQPYIRYEVTDRVILHREACPCGNPAPWLELEGRTDDVAVFREGEKEIRVPPLSLYALMKEVQGLRRFQLEVHPGNRVMLRMEEKKGTLRQPVFQNAKQRLEKYLEEHGVEPLSVILSEEPPRQHPVSGKFKHIINMPGEEAVRARSEK